MLFVHNFDLPFMLLLHCKVKNKIVLNIYLSPTYTPHNHNPSPTYRHIYIFTAKHNCSHIHRMLSTHILAAIARASGNSMNRTQMSGLHHSSHSISKP